ncbi:hypothetical protein HYV50_01545 [Candidatus Pacearchaeota archaeon]|nr:hypothetical protein [Candidatus Pacearchaeota archaeon]
METVSVKAEDIRKLMRDVQIIKETILDKKEGIEETELTDWAKNELEEARKRKSKISHEKAREMLLAK